MLITWSLADAWSKAFPPRCARHHHPVPRSGKERMRRLMDVVEHGRVDPTTFLTHTFSLNEIKEVYELSASARKAWIKVAHQAVKRAAE
jgi:threonine dehydrogenase-like Zn-dependent dehydrogenase